MKKKIFISLFILFFAAYFVLSSMGTFLFQYAKGTVILAFCACLIFLLITYAILRYDIKTSIYYWAPPLLLLSNFSIQVTGGLPQSMFSPLYFILIALVAMKSEVPGVILSVAMISGLEILSSLLSQAWSFRCPTMLGIIIIFSFMLTSFLRILKREKRNVERKLKDMKKTTSILSTPVSTRDRDRILGTLKDDSEGHDFKANEKMKEFTEPILKVIHQTIQSFSSVIFLEESTGDSFTLFECKSHSAYINRDAIVTRNTGVYSWVIKEKEPLLNNQFLLDATLLQYYTRDEDVRSVLMVPLLEETKTKMQVPVKKVIGLLVCDSKEENSFDWEHKEQLKVFAEFIVSIVSLFKNLYWAQWRAIRFRALHDIARRLSESLEIDSVLDILTDIAPKGFDFDLLAIVLTAENQKPRIYKLYPQNRLTHLTGTEVVPASLTGLVIKQNAHHIKPKKISTPYFNNNEQGLDDFNSFFGAPLHRDENVSGVLVLLSKRIDNYPEDKKGPVLFLADLIAVALEKAKLYAETEALSIRDGLTNAFNHRYFQEKLSDELKRAQRTAAPFSLIMLDIDNFKKFNDEFGHQMGDNVLKHLSETVQKTLREIDVFARYGGEEFIIILPETDHEGASHVAEKIRELVEIRPLIAKDKQYVVTVSIGCATFPDNGTDKDSLIHAADKALYDAKKSGRNCVRAALKTQNT